MLRVPKSRIVYVDETKDRCRKLTRQKSLIVMMQEKKESMYYRGKETDCICYDDE